MSDMRAEIAEIIEETIGMWRVADERRTVVEDGTSAILALLDQEPVGYGVWQSGPECWVDLFEVERNAEDCAASFERRKIVKLYAAPVVSDEPKEQDDE